MRFSCANEVARAAERQGKTIVGLDRAAADRLLAYGWPGNLRELSSVIHAAVALARTDVIGEELLVLLDEPAETMRPAVALAGNANNGRLLREAVHRHIASVLEAVGGNKRRAARELGVSRATLERKLREATRTR